MCVFVSRIVSGDLLAAKILSAVKVHERIEAVL